MEREREKEREREREKQKHISQTRQAGAREPEREQPQAGDCSRGGSRAPLCRGRTGTARSAGGPNPPESLDIDSKGAEVRRAQAQCAPARGADALAEAAPRPAPWAEGGRRAGARHFVRARGDESRPCCFKGSVLASGCGRRREKWHPREVSKGGKKQTSNAHV